MSNPMTDDARSLQVVIQDLRDKAALERADNWCNTEDAPIWRSIHRERASVYDEVADQLAALAGGAQQRGPCVPMCALAPTTHVDTAGVERCDLCGHPADQPEGEAQQEIARLKALLAEKPKQDGGPGVSHAIHGAVVDLHVARAEAAEAMNVELLGKLRKYEQ
jgi:hypothetical protein